MRRFMTLLLLLALLPLVSGCGTLGCFREGRCRLRNMGCIGNCSAPDVEMADPFRCLDPSADRC